MHPNSQSYGGLTSYAGFGHLNQTPYGTNNVLGSYQNSYGLDFSGRNKTQPGYKIDTESYQIGT